MSIVIPCFNYGRFIGEAVASAKAQTFKDIEIIVVDGGSTDGETPSIVAGLEEGIVRVFLRSRRHRAGSNRNYGIARARGTYVCCLDADDMLAPTYIEKAVFLMEHYGYDVVSCGVQQFGEATTCFGVAEKVDLQILLNHNQVATCAVFRKAIWKASGGFRDHGDGAASTHVHEDWEFWVRLAAHGARFFNIERDHLFHYRIHDTSVSRRDGVRPLEWQRHRIREMNSEIITTDAIERSIALRLTSQKASEPLINLAPSDQTPAAKSIIVALPWMVLGGAERLLGRLLKHMAEDGWDVSIVTTLTPNSSDGNSEEWFAPAISRIYHLPRFLSPERWDDFLEYLIRARRASRLLIAGSAYAYEQLPSVKSRHRELKVFDLLFNAVGHTKNNRQFAEYIDGNIVESSVVREWLLDHGESDERVATIPSGVSLSALPAPVDRSFRKSLGAKAGDIIIGFCGRWSPDKNPIGFIEIAERLSGNRRLHFVMTGAGQLAKEISDRLAAASSLAGRFHLLGNVTNIEQILASLDILVLPSIVDGRPVVVLEALATGVPVIASKLGGLPELISPKVNGALCPPGDVDAFSKAIAKLAADRKRLARYKAGARAFAERHLDERQMLERYIEVLGTGKRKTSRLRVAHAGAGRVKAVAKPTSTRRRTAVDAALRSSGRVAP